MERDPLWCRFVLRPSSSPITHAAFYVRLRANHLSLCGSFLAVLAAAQISLGSWAFALFGSLLLHIVAIIDCADGDLARRQGSAGPSGAWFDAQSGYTVYALLPIAVAIRANQLGQDGLNLISGDWVLIAGALAASFNLYGRLLYQKYLVVLAQLGHSVEAMSQGERHSWRSRLPAEFGLVGFMTPMLLVCVVLGWEQVFVVFYFLLYALLALLGTIALMRRVSAL